MQSGEASKNSSHGPKYRLTSELNQEIGTEAIADLVLKSRVENLTVEQLLAVSGDVSSFIHEKTRKRRVQLPETATRPTATNALLSAPATAIEGDVNAVTTDTFYALPSGQAKTILDDELQVTATFDDGSELNLMSEGTWRHMSHPVDMEINWRINGYDTEAAQEELAARGYTQEKGNLLGVCHDVVVEIGGIAVKAHIFVVRHLRGDLILGRPWARSAKAQFTNEEDGQYTLRIKSPDGRRQIQLCIAPANHERNRAFVRSPIQELKSAKV